MSNRFGLTNEEVGDIIAMVQHYICMCYPDGDREEFLHGQLTLLLMAKDLTSTKELSPMDILPWVRLLCAAADCSDWAVYYPDHFPDVYGNDVLINTAPMEDSTDFVEDNCSVEDFIKACLRRIEWAS